MATHSENTVTVNHPVEKLHRAYASKDYWTFIAENLSPEPGELNELADGQATLFEVLPLEFLPEAVHSMIKDALKLKRVVSFGNLEGNSFPLSYAADVKGTPASFEGTVTVTGAGDTTTLVYDNETTVDIPFMGGAIEGKVGEYLEELFVNEAKLTDQWISENL